MKIAISADFHLTTIEKNPERFSTLGNILDQLNEMKIKNFIIAGDLFDNENPSFSDFETVVGKDKYKDINFYIIPGNHDSILKQKYFIAKNIRIFENPDILEIGNEKFLFVPYSDHEGIGSFLEDSSSKLDKGNWILISHCDFMKGKREPNNMEKGIYMPLTSRDLNRYKPRLSFLGHIHKPSNIDNVYIPGSPCGLDISETGYRHFLILDTQKSTVRECVINPCVLYFILHFLCVPSNQEVEQLQKMIKTSIDKFDFQSTKHKDVSCIRVKVSGFTSDRSEIEKTLKKGFKGFKFYKDEELDLTELLIYDEHERIEIAQIVEQRIRDLELPDDLNIVDKDEICLEMLKIMFGVNK